MKLITCEHVTLRYDNRVVVHDLSFAVEQGCYLCIVGENGSGKSTLLKSLLGLKRPEAGTITFAPGFNRRQIGYLPQQTPVQKDFPATVKEIVQSGLLNRKSHFCFYTKEEKKRAADMMDALEITSLQNACYRELSGGQQQRVLLARALTAAEKMLILDEPVTGLDPLVTEELYGYIRTQNRQGMTVIMVSHDINTTIASADYILHLAEQQTFFGTTQAYLQSDLGTQFMGGKGSCGFRNC